MLIFESHALTVGELGEAIEAIINQEQYARMEWGILIEAQYNQSYSTIYALNADQFFTPASNNKVITTVPAFLYFGPDYTIKTPIFGSASTGNVQQACLLGRGDASIYMTQVETLAQSMKQSGVSSIGSLIYDDSYFPEFPGAWEWEDLTDTYGAQPNSLILTQNAATILISPSANSNYSPVTYSFESGEADNLCMPVNNKAVTIPQNEPITEPLSVFYRIGDARIQIRGQVHPNSSAQSFSGSVLQPAERFQCVMNYYLSQQGISVGSSEVGVCSVPETWSLLGEIESLPFVLTMNGTLQESNNLFTECFLRTLGANFQGLGGSNAEQEGFDAVRTILSANGVDVSTFVQDDGSGLSRHNLVSPRSLCETLIMIDSQPTGATYRSFLPVAGESGTLANRFVGTPAQGVVQAKTGSMSGVNSLSGFMDASANFPQIVFSILTNFSDQPSSVVRDGIDDIVVLLTQLTE